MTKSEAEIVSPLPNAVWLALAAIAVFTYFFGLSLPFLGPDEPRYAQVAREMMERGDWVTPTLGGFHWFEKPALLYWLEIVSYKIFGIGEFAARFGPAIFGLGVVISLWILGREISTSKSDPQPVYQFANYLALIAASTLGIIVFARGASFDIILTFPMTAAMVSFFIFQSRSEDRGRKEASTIAPLVLFYILIGICLLAKGLVGIVFPFAIVGFYFVLSRRLPSQSFLISLVWGTLISIAVAAIWYLPVYQQNGYEFFREFIIQHHFQRFTSNKYQHPQPFYFFLWVLPLMTIPWLPFFFAAILKIARNILGKRSAEPDDQAITNIGSLSFSSSPLIRFALAWLLVPLVFFSFSGSKLPGYILPAVPAAVIIAAAYVYGLARTSIRWRNTVAALASAVFITVIMLIVFALPRFADGDSVKSLMQAANEAGYGANRVLMFNTVSHNAEFYAAGRLERDQNGAQRIFREPEEIRQKIASDGGSAALVMVTPRQLPLLESNPTLNIKLIKQNGELALALVSAK